MPEVDKLNALYLRLVSCLLHFLSFHVFLFRIFRDQVVSKVQWRVQVFQWRVQVYCMIKTGVIARPIEENTNTTNILTSNGCLSANMTCAYFLHLHSARNYLTFT